MSGMLFNIENAKVEQRGFARKDAERGQNYQVKYRMDKKGDHQITFSNSIFNALGLENNGLAIVPLPDNDGKTVGIGFAVVPEDHDAAKIFKSASGKVKGKKIRNGLLEQYFAEVGVISTTEEMKGKNQKLKLEEYPEKISIDESGNIGIDEDGFSLYVVVSAGEEAEEVEDDNEEVEEEVEA